MTIFTALIPCLLCRQDLDAVPSEHEEHLKEVHKVKFQMDWIIKKTWKERLKKISIENKETFNEDKSDSNENDEESFSESEFIVPDKIDEDSEYQREGHSMDETLEDSMTEIKEDLKEVKQEKMPILKQFSCDNCDKQFKRERNMEQHEALVHGVIIKKEAFFYCETCGKQFTRKMYLKHHKAAVHEGIAYQCDQCNISLVNAGGLKRHKESVHEGIKYTCDQCGASFVQFRSLREHESSVHKGIKYICDQCTVAPFNNERGLKRHKASLHAGISYECSMCGFKSDDRVNLNKHITIIHKI